MALFLYGCTYYVAVANEPYQMQRNFRCNEIPLGIPAHKSSRLRLLTFPNNRKGPNKC